MWWKDILVFTDGSPSGLARLRMAMDLAQAHSAHLEAHVVTGLPARQYGPAAGALEEAYREARHAAEGRAAQALEAVRKVAAGRENFTAIRSDAPASELRAAAAAAARATDLVVLGQPEAGDGDATDTEQLMGALFGGGQPCLMVPRWIAPRPWGKRALIAWKPTAQAARAVQAALPLLKQAERVRVIVADPRSQREGEDPHELMPLAKHLLRHGVLVEAPLVAEAEPGDAADSICGEAEASGADLLVMGAYGHTRFAEFLFGGVSRAIIKDARIPVLLAH
jgi:nucleotide-binding universal stress UspA family protein